jgi:F-type H+-transporting ATPase subunit delta
MNTSLIAVRYAQAFFQLGKDNAALLDVMHDDCKFLLDSMNSSEGFIDFFSNAIIMPGKKKGALKEVFQNQLHPHTLSFLNLIIDNNREKFVKNMLLGFIDFYRKHKGIKSITIITAVPLEPSFLNEIRKVIQNQYHCNVEMDCRVNDEILGGLILMIDGKMIDNSITGQLRAMKKQMMIS